MTIINHPSDGLYPELIVLFRAVAQFGALQSDELVRICFPGPAADTAMLTRLRAALSRWTEIGLFTESDGKIRLDNQLVRGKREALDALTDRLPSFCRKLILREQNCLPLWGDNAGIAADFVRGIAWLLAQDIYGFPTQWDGGAESLEHAQVTGGKIVIQNNTRWAGLRFWARYLGFATGDSGAFQIDPSIAIRAELPLIFGSTKELPARDFLHTLGSCLPVLEFGTYRKEVESNLNEATWRKPGDGQLSMSLSFALQRLELDGTIRLGGKADTGSSFQLTGRDFRIWRGFESVLLQRGKT